MEKKADTKMETKSLIIRPSRWEDIGLFYEWETKPEVTEFFSIRDGQTEEDVVRKYIKDDDDPAARQFTILLKKEATGGVEGTAAGGADRKDSPGRHRRGLESRALENLYCRYQAARQRPG